MLSRVVACCHVLSCVVLTSGDPLSVDHHVEAGRWSGDTKGQQELGRRRLAVTRLAGRDTISRAVTRFPQLRCLQSLIDASYNGRPWLVAASDGSFRSSYCYRRLLNAACLLVLFNLSLFSIAMSPLQYMFILATACRRCFHI